MRVADVLFLAHRLPFPRDRRAPVLRTFGGHAQLLRLDRRLAVYGPAPANPA